MATRKTRAAIKASQDQYAKYLAVQAETTAEQALSADVIRLTAQAAEQLRQFNVEASKTRPPGMAPPPPAFYPDDVDVPETAFD
jgi:hypothetical protein